MQDETGGYCSKCGTVWAAPGKCNCVNYGGGQNRGKTERLMRAAYNEGIEAAAKWLDFADRNHTDDGYEIRKLKK